MILRLPSGHGSAKSTTTDRQSDVSNGRIINSDAASNSHNSNCSINTNCCSNIFNPEDFEMPIIKKRPPLRYGSCIPFLGNLSSTLLLQHEYGLKASQISINTGYDVQKLSIDDLALSASLFERHPEINCHIHCALFANLISSPDGIDRKNLKPADIGKKENNAIKSRISVEQTLNQIGIFPNRRCNCILHTGSYYGKTEIGLSRLANIINEMENRDHLLLETAAGEKGELGSKWPEYRYLFEQLDTSVGFCLDTKHLFASGMSSLNSFEAVNLLFDSVEDLTNGKRPLLFHLNDSKGLYECHVDKHETLFQGKIWSNPENREGLITLLQRCAEKEIDLVLETPGSHVEELSFLQNLEL